MIKMAVLPYKTDISITGCRENYGFPQLRQKNTQRGESSCNGTTVLHVDDQSAFLELTSEYLAKELDDVTLITRSDPQAAVAYLKANEVDCIVSDYQMGTMDGLEFYEQVASHSTEVPFILFTSKDSDTIASEALEAGIDSFLQKSSDPSGFRMLANRISLLVELYQLS
ncbi:response regulator [Halonotius sp. GCM10025705]|uniref:response regulator n=1 Tax=Halonotius sp. GCM10025705 TaxID=3252678 RepID=UPI003617EC0D